MAMSKQGFPIGGLAPESWTDGKTSATIGFVYDAGCYISNNPKAPICLVQFVEDLKSGKEYLTEWMTVDEFFHNKIIKK